MMLLMMMCPHHQQWLHPSDAGSPERRGGQRQAAGGQHVPHGDAGDHQHHQHDHQDAFHDDLRDGCQKCPKVWPFIRYHPQTPNSVIFFPEQIGKVGVK